MNNVESDFLASIRQAAQLSDLAARESAADADVLRTSAAGARRAAIKLFISAATNAERSQQSREIEAQIVRMASEDGVVAIRTLVDLVASGFDFSTSTPGQIATAAWVSSSSSEEMHLECWEALKSTFRTLAKVTEYLNHHCDAESLRCASPSFRQAALYFLNPYLQSASPTEVNAARNLLEILHKSSDHQELSKTTKTQTPVNLPSGKPAGGPSSAPIVQKRTPPAHLPEVIESQPEDWGSRLVRLGDEALEQVNLHEAFRRYRAAVGAGSELARQRLVLAMALYAYDAIMEGDLRAARIRLRTLRQEQQTINCSSFDYLEAIMGVLAKTLPAEQIATRLSMSSDLDRSAADFWTIVAILQREGPAAAASSIPATIDHDRMSGTSSMWSLLSRLLVALLNRDDTVGVVAARQLVNRISKPWPKWCPVNCDALVALAARQDVSFLARLIEDLDDVSIISAPCQTQAGSTLMLHAARAACEGRFEQTLRFLSCAERLSLPDVHRDASARVRQELMKVPQDEIAIAYLHSGEYRRYWSAQSLKIWQALDTSSPDVRHHIAISFHSWAFELEQKRSWDAFRLWKTAMSHWASLSSDDKFWEIFSNRSRAAANLNSLEVAEKSRQLLPRRLLGIHASFVREYIRSDARRARAHFEIISSAPFPRDDVLTALRSLAGTTEVALAESIASGKFADAIADLEAMISIGASESEFARLAVMGYRLECERRHQNKMPALSADQINALVSKVKSGDSFKNDAVRCELARLEYWRGRDQALSEPGDELLAEPYTWWQPDRKEIVGQLKAGLSAMERAGQHFNDALDFDSNIVRDTLYSTIATRHKHVRNKCLQVARKLIDFLEQEVRSANALGKSEYREADHLYKEARPLYEYIRGRPTAKQDANLQDALEIVRLKLWELNEKLNEKHGRIGF